MSGGFFGDFKKFILRGNVVDLAVGIMIGSSFNSIVNSLVSDLINPLISLLGGKPNFSGYSFYIKNAHFEVGNFLNNVISFLIMALVIYLFVVMPVNKLIALTASKPKEPTDKICPFCFKNIPKKATRCPECTSKLKV